eukprot:3856712-Rhodomonas_salina.1
MSHVSQCRKGGGGEGRGDLHEWNGEKRVIYCNYNPSEHVHSLGLGPPIVSYLASPSSEKYFCACERTWRGVRVPMNIATSSAPPGPRES